MNPEKVNLQEFDLSKKLSKDRIIAENLENLGFVDLGGRTWVSGERYLANIYNKGVSIGDI